LNTNFHIDLFWIDVAWSAASPYSKPHYILSITTKWSHWCWILVTVGIRWAGRERSKGWVIAIGSITSISQCIKNVVVADATSISTLDFPSKGYSSPFNGVNPEVAYWAIIRAYM
jgi:hypothetical protein